MSTFLKVTAGVAAGVVVGAGVIVAAKKGYEWNERRKFVNANGGKADAGKIFTFLGKNAENVNTALGHVPAPQQQAAAE